MIPKIIHLCWLSGDPFPDKIQKCVDSWKRILPDYEICLWDKNRFKLDDVPWVKEAYSAKKYAFAADYIRCYALYTYGGVYLDSDVEVLKRFDDLMEKPYFMCFENSEGAIEAATIGAEKGHGLFEKMLDYYRDRHFINRQGSYDTTTIPDIMGDIISRQYKIKPIESPDEFDESAETLCVYPKDYFSPMVDEELLFLTKRTYSIHHYAGSWQSPLYRKFRLFVLKLLGSKTKQTLGKFWRRYKS